MLPVTAPSLGFKQQSPWLLQPIANQIPSPPTGGQGYWLLLQVGRIWQQLSFCCAV